MKPSNGTPNTLRERIKAGIERYKTSDVQSIVRDDHGDILTAFIMAEVRDHMAQIFGFSYMRMDLRSEAVVAKELWKKIFGDSI